MKKKVLLAVFVCAFSAQILYAQKTLNSNLPICEPPVTDAAGVFLHASSAFGDCPLPTPTPTPIPTPTPTPTPTESGSVGPKYVVLSVTYAPPGASSTVTYSNSTLFGSSLSLTSSLTNATSLTVTLEQTADLFGIGTFNGSSFSQNFTQEADSSTSIAVTDTTTESFIVRGPSSSAVGISHDEDVIWLWLNPTLNLDIPSPTTLQWDSIGFDNRDPSGDLDIFPIQVKFLKHPETIPQNIQDVLNRSWVCLGSSDPECSPGGANDPKLTQSDFDEILKADPFTDPTYLINVPTGSNCTTDGRFCRGPANHSFNYSPPPSGGQPITQTFSETRTAAASQGVGASVSFQLGFSKDFGVHSPEFLADLIKTLKVADTLTLTNKLNLLNNEQLTQTSAFSITGPTVADNYTGPAELNMFQDNVYGTFMFGAIPQPTFDVSVSPASQSVSVNNCVDSTVHVLALVSGFNSSVTLSLSGLPQGATSTFTPNPVIGGGFSTLHVCTASSTPLGSSPLTIQGVSGIEAHTTPAVLAVTDFALGASPSSQSVVLGGTAVYTISVSPLAGFSGSVTLSASTSCGATATLAPASITGSGSSTLTVTTSAATPLGNCAITIGGVNGALSHTTNVTLAVTSVPSGDFGLSATPSSQTVNAGDSAFYTVSTSALNGFAGTVALSASGPGNDIFVDLSPGSITGAGFANLTISTSDTTPAGTYFIFISGTSGSQSHNTSVSITVNSSGCLGRGICPAQ